MSKAEITKHTFSMQCSVTTRIGAPAARVWALLTNAQDFPRWNSTVSKIEGSIAIGEKLALQAPAAPGRTFTPKVTTFEAPRSMVWSDGFAPMFSGVRTFTLAEEPSGETTFTMHERFAGVMLPLIRKSLPDFAPIFEQYAADLKREAERAS